MYEKIHQTIDRVFHHDIVQKHHVISNIFCNSLLGVGHPGDDDDNNNRTKQKTVKHYSLLAIHLYLAHLCWWWLSSSTDLVWFLYCSRNLALTLSWPGRSIKSNVLPLYVRNTKWSLCKIYLSVIVPFYTFLRWKGSQNFEVASRCSLILTRMLSLSKDDKLRQASESVSHWLSLKALKALVFKD